MAGNNTNFYACVSDINTEVDIFGLNKYNSIAVLGRKIYQNPVDFGGGVPIFVDPIVWKTNPTAEKLLDEGLQIMIWWVKAMLLLNWRKEMNLHHVLGADTTIRQYS